MKKYFLSSDFMKKSLSLIMATLMLFCSVFSANITGFASTNVDEAIELKLNEKQTVKTTYDPSPDYECGRCWTTFKPATTGAYTFILYSEGENSMAVPLAYASKADTTNIDKAIEPSGMIMTLKGNIKYVLDLKAGVTYYVDICSVDFDYPEKDCVVDVTVTTHTHKYENYIIRADTECDGEKGQSCSECYAENNVVTIPYIKTISLSATSYTYNGKVKTPSVTVKDRKGKVLKKNTDYTVSYSKGRKYVGKYNVKITFKGNYEGSVTKTFYIKPPATSITSISSLKKGFKVKWSKKTTQTTGYQIQYATNSKFKNAKSVRVTKNSTVYKTISKLSGKKKYYVRVRTYKTVKVNGKATNIYSAWSKTKTVTTKK